MPPHQAYFYEAALKQRGVETKIYNYPGSGHSLLPVEHGMDADYNISAWMDKFLIAPFVPPYVEELGANQNYLSNYTTINN